MSDDMQPGEATYSNIRTLFGSTHRTARWHLSDEVDVLTAFGRSSFDLRLVETTGRPTVEMSVTCILGTVSLVVPPGTLVVLDGTSFLARAACEVEPGPVSALPRIEVTATTILGRVKIVSRDGEVLPEALGAPAGSADHDTPSADAAEAHDEWGEALSVGVDLENDDDDAAGPADDDSAPLAS
ncbi:MAG: hypothetical protein R2707_14625 [Acidimicrobiales bacterium]